MIAKNTLAKPVLFIAAVLLFAGCSKDSDEAVSSRLTSEDTVLAYVPADTPYVMANVEPLPDDLLDKFEPQVDAVLRAYQGLFTTAFNSALQDAGADTGSDEGSARAQAVAEEVASLMSVEGLQSAGFGRESTMVLYGNGLLPVLRIRLTDPALLEAAIARLEEKSGEALPSGSIGELRYRYLGTDEVRGVIATVGRDLVLTVAPAAFDDEQLGRLIGLEPVSNNIAVSGRLKTLAGDYGFTEHYLGFVDIDGITRSVLGETSGLNADLFALLPVERKEPSDLCKAEFIEMAGLVPEVVFGYTSISADRLDATVVARLRADIAEGLAAIPAAVPGLGGDKGALVSFGIGLDAMAARNFYEARLDALAEDPFECPELLPLQQGVEAGRVALQQPVPPMVYDFRGFLAIIDSLEGMDLATNTPPASVEGRFLLAMRNAPNLLQLGAMFSPDLAALSVAPDGKPVRVESEQLAGVTDNAWIAMTEDAIAISTGEGMEQKLGEMLQAPAADNGTFLSASFDMSRYYAFISEAIKLSPDDDGEAMPEEMQDAVVDLMTATSGFYDRTVLDMRLTVRGLEFVTTTKLKK